MHSRWLIGGVLAALSAPALPAATTLHGVVRNGTTGRTVPGVEVVLLDLQGTMEPVASTTSDSAGRFQLSSDGIGQRPMLLRAIYQGVNYHQPLPPGQVPGEVAVDVFDVTSDPSILQVTTRIIAFQPHQSILLVGEEYRVENRSQPPRAYYRSDGSFEFALPEGGELAQVEAWGPSGMPVVQGTSTRQPGRYAILFPFRPGENGVRLSYHVPYTGEQASLHLPSVHAAQTVMLLVPPGVQLTAEGFSPAGSEQGWNVYVRQGVAAGVPISVNVSGAGAETPPAGAAPGTEAAANSGGIAAGTIVLSRMDRLRWVLLGGFALLFFLGALFLRLRWKQLSVKGSSAVSGTVEHRVEGDLEELKNRLFRLELRYQAGTISEERYRLERQRMLETLRALVRD